MDASTPVVVLRSGRHGGLAVARSLGRLGIPVYAVDHDPRMLLFSSKYCKEAFVWDFAGENAERSVDYLLNIGRKIGHAILVPTTDAAALFVATHADALRRSFSFPLIPAALAQSLCSKKEMFFLARRLGVPTPDTFFPESRIQAAQFAKDTRFPVIMKPVETATAKGPAARKAIVRSPEELLTKYDLMQDPQAPNVMLQEYIPGGEETSWMFNGYFDEHSRFAFGVTGRKIRQHRPYAGITSLGVCVPNPRLTEITTRFMADIGYRGILDIGFRYDARDDQYKVFDVNPRLGCTFRLFVSDTGTDVVRAMYLGLTGQAVSAGQVKEGRRWMVEDLDLASSFYYWRDGNLSLKEWLASYRGVEESALFAWDDLRPLFKVAIDDCRLMFSKSDANSGERDLDAREQPAVRPVPGNSMTD